ncbi:hypothetical protein [uncultured Tateyamaria sp.]|uniref:hypothetical protein n=1 Tax=uncultured Tateyamaria sp. TaxID=455651 RepID=UPI00262A84F9|nr:hypothetical protein [uncultured Tateyamaria sp.]
MKISLYTPDLSAAEAERFWMTPVEVCRLAAIGEASDPKVKKLLNTLSDRGHVPFVKSGKAKTAPRLYSLVSAAMLRVIFDITRDGRTYKYAQPVADAVRNTMLKCVDELSDLSDFDLQFSEARIVFADMKDDGTPRTVKWHKAEISGGMNMAYSVYDAGYLIFRVLGIYADYWHDDLVARGEIDPPEPMQIGDDGWPIDGGSDG